MSYKEKTTSTEKIYITKIKKPTVLKDWEDISQNANNSGLCEFFHFTYNYLLYYYLPSTEQRVSAEQLTYIISFYPPNNPCFINKNTKTLRGKET